MREKQYISKEANKLAPMLMNGWKLFWLDKEWDVLGVNVTSEPFSRSNEVELDLMRKDPLEEVTLHVPLYRTLTIVREQDPFPKLSTGDLLTGPNGVFYIVVQVDPKNNNPRLLRLDPNAGVSETSLRLTYSDLNFYHSSGAYGPLTPVMNRAGAVMGLNHFRKKDA